MIATIPALGTSPRKTNRISDHQDHPHHQVVQHVLGRDVDQVGPLVEDPDVHPPSGRMPDVWISFSFCSRPASAVTSDFSYLRIKTMPSMTSSSSIATLRLAVLLLEQPADDPQPRPMLLDHLRDLLPT